MKPPVAAGLLLILVSCAAAQDTRPPASFAAGPAKEGLSAILALEDSRTADAAAWKKLLDRRDPTLSARALLAIGRVGEPALKPLLVEVLDAADFGWTREAQRAAAIAVGLFGDPDLFPRLAKRATPRDVFFALGLMKKLPAGGKPPIADWTDAPESRPAGGAPSTFEDPVVAALRWGATVPEPVFADLAKTTLLARDAFADRRTAAVDYFARSKAPAPADLKPALTALLESPEPELAGLAARALAKSQGAGDPEAAAIELAFGTGVERVAQVDRVRALGAIKAPGAAAALVNAINLSRSDPAVRRTVMEALKGVAWDQVRPETKKTALALVRAIAVPAEGERPAPPDVRGAAVAALAAIDPAQFRASLPELRLAAPWPVRAAAGEACVALGVRDGNWILRFLSNPDRRVGIATLEALAESPKLLASLVEHPIPPNSFDPVELALMAKALAAADKLTPEVLASIGQRIPDHEVEALQSVLDAAGKIKANDLLTRYAGSGEISLRKRAVDLLAKNGVEAKEAPGSRPVFESGAVDRVLENPAPMALIETTEGPITIQLFALDAPLTVQNFLKLAKSGFYDGILWHRVVPAFVAQAGCPRGDGWGGPGYTIRCEVNDRTYRRGSIGMALAGKDTGGCQFFICHRALPHLDGRYTLFGQVIDGMDVVDRLGQEDCILKIREL